MCLTVAISARRIVVKEGRPTRRRVVLPVAVSGGVRNPIRTALASSSRRRATSDRSPSSSPQAARSQALAQQGESERGIEQIFDLTPAFRCQLSLLGTWPLEPAPRRRACSKRNRESAAHRHPRHSPSENDEGFLGHSSRDLMGRQGAQAPVNPMRSDKWPVRHRASGADTSGARRVPRERGRNNLAKSPLIPDCVIARARLGPKRRQGSKPCVGLSPEEGDNGDLGKEEAP